MPERPIPFKSLSNSLTFTDMLVCPSILAADFGNMESEIQRLNQGKSDYFHLDIMDGVFVPNISFGFPVTKAIQKHAEKPLDFHLMIQNPDLYLPQCADSGAEIISVHFEVCRHLHRTVHAVKDMGIKAGVALNPHTPVEGLTDVLPELDLVLLMSVNPGFGSQKFIENTYDKLARLKKLADRFKPDLLIEIDGGVNEENAGRLRQAGANMLVAGSFVFKPDDPNAAIASLKNC